MKSDYFFYAFIAFIFLRFFLTGPLAAIHTIIVFSVPIIYIVLKKHYHILKFDVSDTIPSVITLSLFSFVVAFFVLLFSIFLGNLNWVNIFDISGEFLALLFLLSFNYELLIRYFFQGFFEKKFSLWLAILFSNIIGSLILLPDLLSAGLFFLCGLLFGFVFNRTNDIYGVTIAGFILRVAVATLA